MRGEGACGEFEPMQIAARLGDARDAPLDAPLRFTSSAEGVDLTPVSFALSEAMSAPYELRVVVETSLRADELAERILGRVGQLSFGAARFSRTVRGIICDVESRGVARDQPHAPSQAEVVIRPKLALLDLRTNSRIFQDATVSTVVDALLDSWGVARRWALSATLPGWPYNVQHQETDLAFILRVLAAEGVYFYFDEAREEQGDALRDDVPIVFGDAPSSYGSVDAKSAEGGVTLHMTEQSQSTGRAERLFSFTQRRRLAPREVLLREYLPVGASVDRTSSASASPRDDHDAFVHAPQRTHYEYLPTGPLDAGERAAEIALGQVRRDARAYEGEGSAARLAPGHLFHVVEHGDASLDGAYVVTHLSTRGHDPRFLRAGGAESTLIQALGAARAIDAYRPRRIHRAMHQGLDTAVVVGPPGSNANTDTLGRVRVRFHWDRDRPSMPEGERDWQEWSTWLRVAQPWNGPGHGAFFLPRAGSEVLVGYIGGDLNRPVIVGSLANSATPPPFALPSDAGLSGIVSRGLENDGQSELVFDDTGGRESARLVSQRRLELRAAQDLETRAGRDAVTEVAGVSRLEVGRDLHETVRGERVVAVNGKSTFTAAREAEVNVRGHATVALDSTAAAVTKDAAISVGGTLSCHVEQELRLDVSGYTIARHDGPLMVSVGALEKPASYALHAEGVATIEGKEGVVLESPGIILLRCGTSTISMFPDAIEIRAASVRVDAPKIDVVGDETIQLKAGAMARIEAPKVFALSESATLALTANARLDGVEVQLAAPPDPSEGPKAKKHAPPPTRITVVDQDGAPVVGEPCLLRLADGTTRAAVTDADGVATVYDVIGSAEVDLIDLSDWEQG